MHVLSLKHLGPKYKVLTSKFRPALCTTKLLVVLIACKSGRLTGWHVTTKNQNVFLNIQISNIEYQM